MRWLCILILLAGCGGGAPKSTPVRGHVDIENACTIVRAKPLWRSQMRAVERKWGTPTSVQMAIIYHESKFVARAKTPRKKIFGIIPSSKRISSAYGYAQVLDGTWDRYRKETGNRRASRTNYGDAVDFIGWYNDHSNRTIGISKRDARRLYLAYHQGHTGYKRGSYRQKRWLLDVASQVAETERKYRKQLRSC